MGAAFAIKRTKVGEGYADSDNVIGLVSCD